MPSAAARLGGGLGASPVRTGVGQPRWPPLMAQEGALARAEGGWYG
jgi:hypothetical protein